MAIIAIAIISIILFIASVRQEKRRFVNVGLFLLAGGFTACSVELLSGDGWLYTYFLSYLFLLFCTASIVSFLVCLAASKEHHDSRSPRNIVLIHLGLSLLSLTLIPFFYYGAGGPLFISVADALVHLPLMIAVYLALSFAALVIYTFLSHIVPTRTKWDYILILDNLANEGRMTARLRQRLDLVRRLSMKVRGRARIILPNAETAITARDYLCERGIEPDDVISLAAEDDSRHAKLAALTDAPCAVKPYHNGIIITDDCLACRTAHELSTIGLRGTVLGCSVSLGKWAVKILEEYRGMLWLHSRAVCIVIVLWLILCALTLNQ